MQRNFTPKKKKKKKKGIVHLSLSMNPKNVVLILISASMKMVSPPGPFLAGSGPKYVKAIADILGEPLSKEEIEELVSSCNKTKRQLNMGRDGLTHNMLENIHAHWKRRRVCKIKCKGVCTVDMDNVREKLEEKTGGKIIYSKGGVIYLFRGRNYNYRTRPRFPLMLWRPVTPVYPKLVQRVPEGLTLEEVTEMRKKARSLMPICKLAKNGVYCSLAKNVREAFDACELVRINCQGLNPSDYRKIGAKLKDLIPCVLLSFEQEHILMWRGREWKSSIPEAKDKPNRGMETVANNPPIAAVSEDQESSSPSNNLGSTNKPWTEGVLLLRNQAIESGSALILDDSCLDADIPTNKQETVPCTSLSPFAQFSSLSLSFTKGFIFLSSSAINSKKKICLVDFAAIIGVLLCLSFCCDYRRFVVSFCIEVAGEVMPYISLAVCKTVSAMIREVV
nr:CRS2-associated factor 1, chloroplastic [Ipomoea batatas]